MALEGPKTRTRRVENRHTSDKGLSLVVKHRSSKATWPLLSNKCSHLPRRHNSSNNNCLNSSNSKDGLNNSNLVTLRSINRTACTVTSLVDMYMAKDHTILRHTPRTIKLNHQDNRRTLCPMRPMHHPMAPLLSNNSSSMPTNKEPVSPNRRLKHTLKDTVSKDTTPSRPGTNRKQINTDLLRLGKLPSRQTIRRNRTTQALLMLQINKSPLSKVPLVSNVTTPSQLSSLNRDNTLQALDSQALHSESVRTPKT